jgi:RNA polymerase sigma factor (sigma-70 family)
VNETYLDRHLVREIAPQVLGVIARKHGDFAAAEDAVQEALIAASVQWPTAGIPTNPRGWLYQVAIRKLADQARSEAARRKREESVATEIFREEPFVAPRDSEIGVDEDDTLVLLFMCCHPALTRSSAIALTLRAVGGLTTAEIASAFLVPEATMAQRISRAKSNIKSSNIPFSMPTDAEKVERLSAVLHVLYLIFNEGYTSSAGAELNRPDLSNEAIRLTRVVRELMPDDGEVGGLLALMLLTDARRSARTGKFGELIPLDDQDRTLWNRAMIEEGVGVISDALTRGTAGPYQLQASIAAIHDEAESTDRTDWKQILAIYDLLLNMSENPMVALNRAISVAMVGGNEAGLIAIDALEKDSRIAGHYRLDAVRGHLYERAGNPDKAIQHFRAAAERTLSIPERNYLTAKAAGLQRGRQPVTKT